MPQPNVVELVLAGQLTCEIDLGGGSSDSAGTHGLNATDAAPNAARSINEGL